MEGDVPINCKERGETASNLSRIRPKLILSPQWQLKLKWFLFFFQNKEWSDYASFAHDAVWTYALALDQLLRNYSSVLDSINSNTTSTYVKLVLSHLMG